MSDSDGTRERIETAAGAARSGPSAEKPLVPSRSERETAARFFDSAPRTWPATPIQERMQSSRG